MPTKITPPAPTILRGRVRTPAKVVGSNELLRLVYAQADGDGWPLVFDADTGEQWGWDGTDRVDGEGLEMMTEQEPAAPLVERLREAETLIDTIEHESKDACVIYSGEGSVLFEHKDILAAIEKWRRNRE